MSLFFDVHPNPHPVSPEERAEILADPGFGARFTDHMAVATWTAVDGWHDSAVVPYGPFSLDPATAVLHYAQEIFEGMKAYRHADDSIWLFRPDRNADRLARSARRLALPELTPEDFIASIEALVTADAAWVPRGVADGDEKTLYLRPFMFASEKFLGVRAAQRVSYCCIASPAGAYFSHGVKPVSIWVSDDYTRASPGGTGAAKCGGNYAASLIAQTAAAAKGCEQVLFADGAERKYVEELGGMNVFLVTADGELVTPELSGSILEGVTRDSVLTLATEHGLTPVERRIEVAELLDGVKDGSLTEVFACGTAAVITPIGLLRTAETDYTVATGGPGELTQALRTQLLDIQYGRAEDTHHWLHQVR
jgi:branched-chain amino acid aminotransferase